MPISFHCPSCRLAITLPDQYAGQKARCKACAHKLIVPGSSEPLDVLPAGPARTRPAAAAVPADPFTDLESPADPEHDRDRAREDAAVTSIRAAVSVIVFFIILCCAIPVGIVKFMLLDQRLKQKSPGR